MQSCDPQTSSQKKKVVIGIDLGDVNAAVGVWEQDRVRLITNKEGGYIYP